MNKITIDCVAEEKEGRYGIVYISRCYRIRLEGLTDNDCEYVELDPVKTLRKRMKKAIEGLELRLSILQEYRNE